MSDILDRLQGIGAARRAAIGFAPARSASTSTNPFTRARDAQHAAETDAERASKRAALAAMPDSAIERHAAAVATYRKYRGADALTRAHIRQHFPDLELGRQLDDLDPEPAKTA